MAARLAFKDRRSRQVSLLLDQLKWLPIEERVEEKLFTLVVKARKTICPTYLIDLLTDYAPA